MTSSTEGYEYRVLSAQERKSTAENMLRDVERQIFQQEQNIQSQRSEGQTEATRQQEQNLDQLKTRADRIYDLIQEIEKEMRSNERNE